MKGVRVPWVSELAQAARASYDEAPPRTLAQVMATFASLPYRFLGDRHPIVSLEEARARGWAACADAAAALAAAAFAWPDTRRAIVCVEAPPHLAGYSHVRLVLDSRAYDPYSAFRAPGLPPSCEFTIPVVELLEARRVTLRPVVQ